MTELEKIEYAKTYIEKLANGISPLDDSPLSNTDIVNNIRVSRCLFFVNDILRQVIENNGITKQKRSEKLPFKITAEELSAYSPSSIPLSVSEIARHISSLVDLEKYSNLNYKKITDWLTSIGALTEIVKADGKKKKQLTDAGKELGLFYETRHGTYGEYTVIMYDQNAQQFIVDHLDTILGNNN